MCPPHCSAPPPEAPAPLPGSCQGLVPHGDKATPPPVGTPGQQQPRSAGQTAANRPPDGSGACQLLWDATPSCMEMEMLWQQGQGQHITQHPDPSGTGEPQVSVPRARQLWHSSAPGSEPASQEQCQKASCLGTVETCASPPLLLFSDIRTTLTSNASRDTDPTDPMRGSLTPRGQVLWPYPPAGTFRLPPGPSPRWPGCSPAVCPA